MGTRSSKLQTFEYYTNVKDPNLGYSDVYTCKSLPMTFIVKRKHHNCDQALIKLFQQVEKQQSQCLVTMFGCQQDEFCNCNSLQGDAILSYWQYYSMYLLQLLQKRIAREQRFSEEQIWHIINVCLEGYSVLRSKNVYYDFLPQNIVIAPPEGKIKLFWSHIEIKNNHLAYFQQFNRKSPKILNYFSPEQLHEIRSNHYNTSLNFEKCNIFSFGMLLFYLTSLIDPLNFYNSTQNSIDQKSIIHIIQSKIKPYYSYDVQQILQSCLQPDPIKRNNHLQLLQKSKRHYETDSSLIFTTTSKALTQKSATDSKLKRISLKRNK